MAGLDDVLPDLAGALARKLSGSVRVSSLDSAFSQRTRLADGVDVETWEVEFPISNSTEYDLLMAFFAIHGLVVPFYWTPPGEGSARAFFFESFEPESRGISNNQGKAVLAYANGVDLSLLDEDENIVLITTADIDVTILQTVPVLSLLQDVFITAMVMRPSSVSGFTSGFSASLGLNLANDDIFRPLIAMGLEAPGECFIARTAGESQVATRGLTVNFEVTDVAVAASFLIKVDLIGFALSTS